MVIWGSWVIFAIVLSMKLQKNRKVFIFSPRNPIWPCRETGSVANQDDPSMQIVSGCSFCTFTPCQIWLAVWSLRLELKPLLKHSMQILQVMGKYHLFPYFYIALYFLYSNFDVYYCRFGNAPQGLVWFLRRFEVRKDESPEAARRRLYKRLWCLLWVSFSMSLYLLLFLL